MCDEASKAPAASVLLIGNELLSGKVTDQNGSFLIKELRALGVSLREVRIIPDVVETIAEAVLALSEMSDHVFTSGGVGPTHDDITLEGVAQAFGAKLVENATVAHHIHTVFKDDEDRRKAFMKAAYVPEGTTLLQCAELWWPVYRVNNVYILPGVPEIFRQQFTAIRNQFHSDPFFLRTIYFRIDEGQLAPTVTEACHRFPKISFGSYPVWKNPDYRVRVTIESKKRETVEDAYQWLSNKFAGGAIFKVVDGPG